MPIIRDHLGNPLVDGRQSPAALDVQHGVTRLLRQHASAVLSEFNLPDGRRADLVGIDRKGLVTIIEIKSSIEDFRADGKWRDYRRHCDFFFFASHIGVPVETFPAGEGLIMADGHGGEILRPAVELKLSAATRKMLTLRFARTSADRLERVLRHAALASLDVAGLAGGRDEK